MTLPGLPSVPTPVEGPEPGLSIAEATQVTESMYTTPYRLTSWASDGAWFKYHSTGTHEVLVDDLLSVISTQVISRGTSYLQFVIYRGPAGASTLGELQLVTRLIGGPTSTTIYTEPGETYFFQFLVTDSDEERPQFGRPVPWYVVLRLSSTELWTDWIDPPENTMAIYNNDSSGAWPQYTNAGGPGGGQWDAPDNPDTDLWAGPPPTWNGDTSAFYDAMLHTLGWGGDMWGHFTVQQYFLDFNPTHLGGPDPGQMPGLYIACWELAKAAGPWGSVIYEAPGTSGEWPPSYADGHHVIAGSQERGIGSDGVRRGVVGFRVLRAHAYAGALNISSSSDITAEALAASVTCSLITALDRMGPVGTFSLLNLSNELNAAGWSIASWADGGEIYGQTYFFGKYIFEQELPTLLGVDFAPNEPKAWTGLSAMQSDETVWTVPDVVEWRASVAQNETFVGFDMQPTSLWGPINFDPDNAGVLGWSGGGGGPEEYAANSAHLCYYDGGKHDWIPVPEATWQAALAKELEYYHARKAAGATGDALTDGLRGLDFVAMPLEFLYGSYPIPLIPPFMEVDGGRFYQAAAVRLHVKPSRFKVALSPKLADATPTYPEDIPPTGATGDGRRTFGRPSET